MRAKMGSSQHRLLHLHYGAPPPLRIIAKKTLAHFSQEMRASSYAGTTENSAACLLAVRTESACTSHTSATPNAGRQSSLTRSRPDIAPRGATHATGTVLYVPAVTPVEWAPRWHASRAPACSQLHCIIHRDPKDIARDSTSAVAKRSHIQDCQDWDLRRTTRSRSIARLLPRASSECSSACPAPILAACLPTPPAIADEDVTPTYAHAHPPHHPPSQISTSPRCGARPVCLARRTLSRTQLLVRAHATPSTHPHAHPHTVLCPRAPRTNDRRPPKREGKKGGSRRKIDIIDIDILLGCARSLERETNARPVRSYPCRKQIPFVRTQNPRPPAKKKRRIHVLRPRALYVGERHTPRPRKRSLWANGPRPIERQKRLYRRNPHPIRALAIAAHFPGARATL
ncbi:hypothetical protein C8R47DRAFT_1228565 [Mycena vitilis]|nr:hypothetical protein C8R47DRAFT_1228565 [Mycena vitilis]